MASWLKFCWNVDPEPLMVPLGTEAGGAVGVAPPPDAVVADEDDLDELPQPAAIRAAATIKPAPPSSLVRRGLVRIRVLQQGRLGLGRLCPATRTVGGRSDADAMLR
jgi:hypothetical protein